MLKARLDLRRRARRHEADGAGLAEPPQLAVELAPPLLAHHLVERRRCRRHRRDRGSAASGARPRSRSRSARRPRASASAVGPLSGRCGMEKSVRPLVRMCAIRLSVTCGADVAVDQRRAERRIGMRPDAELRGRRRTARRARRPARRNAGRRGRRRSRASAPSSAERLDGRLEELRQEEGVGLERALGEPAIRSARRGSASTGSSAKVPRRGCGRARRSDEARPRWNIICMS